MDTSKRTRAESECTVLQWRHVRIGWLCLLVFLTLGIVLEALHGFKVGSYLNTSSGPRRLMFTLAHAHGTLLGLVHIVFGVTLPLLPKWPASARQWVSLSLSGASVLLPGGFLLGGFGVRGGDPGLGILLVPLGALLLLAAVAGTFRAVSRLP